MKFITTPKQAFMELEPLAQSKKAKAALKVLATTLDMMEHQDKKAHWLFGKLWLYMFERNLIEYKSSQGAIDSIRMALERPMDVNFKLIADVYGGKIPPEEIRTKLAEKINLMLNDPKLYD